MCHQQCPLVGEVVVEVGNGLYSHISFSSARRADYEGQPRMHACTNSLHLCGRERNSISVVHVHWGGGEWREREWREGEEGRGVEGRGGGKGRREGEGEAMFGVFAV